MHYTMKNFAFNLIKGNKLFITILVLSGIFTAVTFPIVVMEHGDIIEIGTHEELLAQNGMYNKLWSYQSQLGRSAKTIDELEQHLVVES